MLDHDFIMIVLSEFYDEITEFKLYLTYYYEKEVANIVGFWSRNK